MQSLHLGWGGDLRDKCTVQVRVASDSDWTDPYKLDKPAGAWSWLHLHSLLSKFLSQNERWAEQLSYDQWAVCRSFELRIIAVMEPGARRMEDIVFSRQVGGLPIRGSTPCPVYHRPDGYTQADCSFFGRGRDQPRKEGILYKNTEAVHWTDVGLDTFEDLAYVSSGGRDQNKPPVQLEEFLEAYWDQSVLDSTPEYIVSIPRRASEADSPPLAERSSRNQEMDIR